MIVFCHLAQAATSAHLAAAQTWQSPSAAWAPPPSLHAADDAVLASGTPWQAVNLPHAVPRSLRVLDPALASGAPVVQWWRLSLPASALAATAQGTRLYIPRWQTIGTLAVYVQGRLVWQSRGDRPWNSFNDPIWISLSALPHEAAHTGDLQVHLRMASQQGVGGALSSLWVGPTTELLTPWRWRMFWQTGLVSYWRAAFLLMSLFALALWFKYRRSQQGEVRLFLLFFAMAACQSVAALPYLVDSEGLDMDFAWFTWIAMAAQLAALGCMVCFLCLAHGQRWPRGGRALALYLAAAALAALPSWWPAYTATLPLLRLLMVPPTLLLLTVAAVGAWRLRSASNLLLAAWGAMVAPISLHDMAMQNYWGNIEGIYLTPYVSVGLFTLFLVLAFSRYSHAQDQAARARATLAERLAAQEHELGRTHERLRTAEREQTLMLERQRLMREMHDGVGASLTSALRLVQHGQARHQPVDVAQVLKECIDDLKISIDSLEPVDADLLALLAGLRFRLEQRLGEAGITLYWRTSDVPALPWLDAQNALHVLRILQEVLTNIVKHSGATAITVSTAEAAQGVDPGVPGVQVCVHDNGRPFLPPDALPPGRRGLGNVRSRTLALGGHCGWQPLQPSAQGTVFTLWLPLRRGG
ncbi:histidine kinase [Acidovorax sp. sif1233]|nr:histidine kinase [Acidovorax sp. sif1233]